MCDHFFLLTYYVLRIILKVFQMAQPEKIAVEKFVEEIVSRVRELHPHNTATLRNLRKEFSKRLAKSSPQEVVDIALRLLEFSGMDYRFIAYELVCRHRAALQSLRANKLKRLGRGIDNWGAVDAFACYLSGPAWREKQISDSLILEWARSKDRWWRRAAVVSTVALNNKARGGRGDTPRTLRVCRMLVNDRDDMVVKALSWALRELAKRDVKAARDFLRQYEDKLAARVVREVRNKLKTGLKNPRQK